MDDQEETKEENKNTGDIEEFKEQKVTKTRKGTFVGTAYYVSPEMLNDSHAGPEADYWALGCVLYKLLYG